MKEDRGGLPERLVLATGNAGKLRELREILAPWNVEVQPQSEFTNGQAAETGLSFVENAILKARFAAGASGWPAIADDSGLEVDALRGAPGIHSARYAGPAATDADNNLKLLAELDAVPPPRRGARYRCAVVLHALAARRRAADRPGRLGRPDPARAGRRTRIRLRPRVRSRRDRPVGRAARPGREEPFEPPGAGTARGSFFSCAGSQR